MKWFFAILALTLAVPALAGTPPQRLAPTAVTLPHVIPHLAVSVGRVQACGLTYDNTTNLTGYFYAPGAGVEVADDLHMISGGHLCGADFVYYKSTTGTTVATLTFYENDATDTTFGPVLAGPYVISDLPNGFNSIHVNLAPGTGPPTLGADIWLGVAFSTAGTGLVMSDPPSMGSSDDLFMETPPGMEYYFGGDPVASFGLAVYADIATPAKGSTWGRIKTLYR